MNLRAFFVYLLVELLMCCVIASQIINSEREKKLLSNNTSLVRLPNADLRSVHKTWISQLFHKAQMSFQMDSNVNEKCKMDFSLYTMHLKNQTMWAVKMMDSSQWPLHGIISGSVYHLGNYDECLAISSHGIDGQYCLPEVTYNYSGSPQNKIVSLNDEEVSAWTIVNTLENNPAKINRKKLMFAMCIPSSCKPIDLKVSLSNALLPIFKAEEVNILINVNPLLCQTRKEAVYPVGFYIVGVLFAALFVLVILSTLFDSATSTVVAGENSDKQRRGLFKHISEIFCLTRNFKKLVTVDAKAEASFNYIKVVTTLAIIAGHRIVLFSLAFPAANAIFIEYMYSPSVIAMYMPRSAFADIFIVISGFQTFYLELEPMIKHREFYLFSNILLRWIRLIPAFGVIILYIVYILPYTGESPIWKYFVTKEVDKCKETWWAALLGLGNIIKSNKMCLPASWYISVEYQLMLIGGVLLYIYTRHQKIGIIATLLTLFVSMVITFFNVYINQYNAIPRTFYEVARELQNDRDFSGHYIATYTKCGPYLVGFLSAYLSKLLRERNFKLTTKQAYLLLLVFALISEASQLYGTVFLIFDRPYNRFENSLYAACFRVLAATFCGALYCTYFTSGLGIFNRILEWKIWIVWGRLGFSLFLLSFIMQFQHVISQKHPLSLGVLNMVWWILSDLIVSHVVALLFYLFVEAPILNIRFLIKRKALNMHAKFKVK